jgi:uncharacterized protein
MSDSTRPPSPYEETQPLSASDEKLWATLVHLGGIFFGFLPALIGYILLKDRGPLVREHTGAALNFQITLLIAYLIATATLLILIGFLLFGVAYVLNIVFSIIAAIAANKGERYEYPLAIKFVK